MQHERQEYVAKRAYELAVSGEHINPITIVSALVKEGYPEAVDLLNSGILRSDLRTVCALHWKGVTSEDETSAMPTPGPHRSVRSNAREE